jgi:hypothetical protein
LLGGAGLFMALRARPSSPSAFSQPSAATDHAPVSVAPSVSPAIHASPAAAPPSSSSDTAPPPVSSAAAAKRSGSAPNAAAKSRAAPERAAPAFTAPNGSSKPPKVSGRKIHTEL